jgi:hypothetical protein
MQDLLQPRTSTDHLVAQAPVHKEMRKVRRRGEEQQPEVDPVFHADTVLPHSSLPVASTNGFPQQSRELDGHVTLELPARTCGDEFDEFFLAHLSVVVGVGICEVATQECED